MMNLVIEFIMNLTMMNLMINMLKDKTGFNNNNKSLINSENRAIH